MKFYLSATIALFLLVGNVSAQHANIGIKGGLNVFNINNDNGSKYDPKVGFNLGLLGHIHLSKQVALQPEILYSGQGAKYTVAGTDVKINLDYVNVPVLLQYMFDNGFRLEVGPQVGFLVGAKSKIGSTNTDIKNNLKSVDFALAGGIGYVHPATGFGVDLRYNLGLININENTSVKSTNRGLQVGVFYLFGHK